MIFNTNETTLNETPKPIITRLNVPKEVNSPAPEFAVVSQNKVPKPVKNSFARSLISPKPLLIASIIAEPILFSSYIHIFIKICI